MSSMSTFPRFSELAIELRIQIWKEALRAAASKRTITVAIHHHPAITIHTCIPLGEPFCGNHTHCPFLTGDLQPTSSLVSVFNGYFALPTGVPFNDADTALHAISLACMESHEAFLSEFPETMTIYKKRWSPGGSPPQRRRVRCHPATDTLLVAEASSFDAVQQHPSLHYNHPTDAFHGSIKAWFPENLEIFADFRRITSMFQHVVLSRLVGMEIPRSDDLLVFWSASDCEYFKRFLVMFERVEHVELRSLPRNSSIRCELKRVVNIEKSTGPMDSVDSKSFVGIPTNVLNCEHEYSKSAEGQIILTDAGDECCWVPIPKGFDGTWLFSSRDTPTRS